MRGLARGLNVLDFVARSDGVTFSEIVEATGLSKAVTHRILAELDRSGFVWRSQVNRKYFVAPLIAATPGGSYARLLLSASAQPMAWLVKEVQWPSDLFVLEGAQMVLIESSRPSSPFHLRWSRIGRRAPILLSSVGRAVLSEMSQAERDRIYDELRSVGEWKSQMGWLSRPLDAILRDVSERGYAEREAGFAGPVLERRGETSIGVSLVAKGVVIGAINVWWSTSADSGGCFARQLFPSLRRCKRMIEKNLQNR